MSVVALNVNLLGTILLFADNSEAAKVSRNFRTATEKAKEFVCRQLKMVSGSGIQGLQGDVSAHSFIEQMGDVLGKLEVIITNAQRTQMRVPVIMSLYDRLAQLRDHCIREEPGLRETRMVSLLWHLPSEIVNGLHGLIAQGDLPFNVECQRWEDGRGRELIEELAPDMLTERYLNVVSNLPPQESSTNRLRFLHNVQTVAAAPHNSARARDVARNYQGSYSYERFLRSEEIALDAQVSKDVDFGDLWWSLSHFLAPFLGANPPRTPRAQRGWMRDPRNRVGLNRVSHLTLFTCTEIPPEIGQLRNLRHFYYQAMLGWGRVPPRLHTLPPTLAELPALETLSLSGARLDAASFALIARMRQLTSLTLYDCELEQVPDWIAGLSRLHTLVMSNNQIVELPDFLLGLRHLSRLQVGNNAITVLPDALYRQMEPAGSIFGNQSISVDRRNLRQIPFRLWFREATDLPYVGPLEQVIWNQPGNNDLIWFLIEVANITAFLVTLLPSFVLNAGIFLTNLLLVEVVEPIVTLFRDQLGYSRMVQVEPLLAVERFVC